MSQESQHAVQFDDLYRDLILDHYRRPRHKGALQDATIAAEGMNPSCGDEIRVEIQVQDGRLADIAFSGMGCSISQASASMMTDEALNGEPGGKPLSTIDELSGHVQEMLTHEDFDIDAVDVGDLEALSGVAKFPVRIKCALLAWKVLDMALAEVRGEKADADSDIPIRIASTEN